VTGLARRVGTTSGPRDEARPFARGLAPDGPLGRASLGVVPIVWNNVDLPDISPATPVPEVLDEIARLGFDGCQLGSGFPVGDELRFELAARDLRLAEVYVSLPATEAGPTPEAGEIGRERLGLLTGAGGEVLVVALDLSPERAAVAGRADAAGVPRLAPDGWDRLADVVNELAEAADAAGARLAFHPHAGTYVETPAEVEQLLDRTDPGGVGLCLDTGHWRVGGGDPAAGLRGLHRDDYALRRRYPASGWPASFGGGRPPPNCAHATPEQSRSSRIIWVVIALSAAGRFIVRMPTLSAPISSLIVS
jgi:sugar phosphate isomerase/epimerase